MGLFQQLFTRRKRVPIFEKVKEPIRESKKESTDGNPIEPDRAFKKAGSKEIKQETEREADNMINQLQEILNNTNSHIDEIQELVNKVNESVADSQNSIEDKIHTEAVKIYRNVQVVLLDLEKKVAKQEKMEQEIQTLKNYLKGLTGITAITMLILVFYILHSLGVF